MNKIKSVENIVQAGRAPGLLQQSQLSEEDRSKDAFFAQIAELAEAMIARHGRDFAIGSFVLAAKFIAEGKPLINRTDGGGEAAGAAKPVRT